MRKIMYAPKALEDLLGIKTYISANFGRDKAKDCVRELTEKVRQLERFPEEGQRLEELLDYPTVFYYLVVKPNYIFYRIEEDVVRIVRILNEKQDFLQILFGISSVSEEGEAYWGDE